MLLAGSKITYILIDRKIASSDLFPKVAFSNNYVASVVHSRKLKSIIPRGKVIVV